MLTGGGRRAAALATVGDDMEALTVAPPNATPCRFGPAAFCPAPAPPMTAVPSRPTAPPSTRCRLAWRNSSASLKGSKPRPCTSCCMRGGNGGGGREAIHVLLHAGGGRGGGGYARRAGRGGTKPQVMHVLLHARGRKGGGGGHARRAASMGGGEDPRPSTFCCKEGGVGGGARVGVGLKNKTCDSSSPPPTQPATPVPPASCPPPAPPAHLGF